MSSTIAVPGRGVPDPNVQFANEYVDVANVGVGIGVQAATSDVEVSRSAGEAFLEVEGEKSDVVEIVDGDGFVDYSPSLSSAVWLQIAMPSGQE